MLGRELRVEQPETAGPEAREQMHERDLRGVAGAMKHALAEEGAAQAHPVETADQRLALIGLDRMGMAGGEQFAIEPHDLVVDPGLLTLGAGAHDRFERAVGDHPKSIRPHRLGEAARDDEPVERENSALLRLDPEQVLGVAAFGHRKDADRIGPEQDVRRQLEFSRRGFHVAQSWNRPREPSSRRRPGVPPSSEFGTARASGQALRRSRPRSQGLERHKIPASVPAAEPRNRRAARRRSARMPRNRRPRR